MDGTCFFFSDAVKVLYSLDTSPQHTMIARGTRRTMVRVAHAPAPLGLLGRVPLKACLGAICLASPELVLDRANDYIVYAVDPEESHRAMQRSPTHRGPDITSPSRRSATQVLVGKGFLSGALEEPEEGASSVTGRVRTESRQASAFSSDEDEEGNEVLEVVLRMKEAPQQSREQYRTLMQGMGASSRTGAATPRERASPTPEQRQLMSMLHVIAGALPETKASPASTPAPAPASAPAPVRAPVPTPPAAPSRSDRICYNCGTTSSRTWRMLQLPAGERVAYPASEKPPVDAVPLTWTPKYGAHKQCLADGATRWQACNACGLYFTKYGTSRSERMRSGVRSDKKRATHPPKKLKVEETSHSKFERTLSAVANRDAARLQRDKALHEIDRNASPVRRTASSPVRAMPPPTGSPSRTRPPATPGKYSMPAYMIHSSPATAVNRLLSESENDFDEFHPGGTYPSPSKLLPERAPHPPSPSPVRRSPRKRPHGTLGQVNPYASHDTQSDSGLFAPPMTGPVDSASSPVRRASPASPTSPGLLGRVRRRTTPDALLALPPDEDGECPPSPSADRAQRVQRVERKANEWPPPSPGLGLTLPPRPTAEAPEVFPDGPWLTSGALAALDAHKSAPEVPSAPRRAPLPATVEDASSSQHSSPHNSPESAVEYIEDPYGLLNASGLAVYDQDGNMTLGEGLNMDTLQNVELHGASSFGDHLRDFTAQGGLGLAAHLGHTQTPHVESFSGGTPQQDPGLVAMLDDPGVLALLANCPTGTPQEAPAART